MGQCEENRYIEPPVTGGHEICGEIVVANRDLEDLKIGDIVAVEQIVPCGICDYCRKGIYWMCKRSAVLGFKQYAQGGFAEYVKLNANVKLHKVPRSFTTEQVVLVEPMACAMHAVELAKPAHHECIVFADMGAIGLSMINIASLLLPKQVIGIDLRPYRGKLGIVFGADEVIDAKEESVYERVCALTDGYGCDVYVEASGSPESVR